MEEFTMEQQTIHSKPFTGLLMVLYAATLSMGMLVLPTITLAEEKASLYDRLGGKGAITAVVDVFADRLVADRQVGGRFASADLKRFKMLNTELVCMATGGPCKYPGKDMKNTHNGMRISEKEFNIVAGHLKATLRKFKVPKQEQKELLGIIGSLQKDIVERS
jgi:hemoglobin